MFQVVVFVISALLFAASGSAQPASGVGVPVTSPSQPIQPLDAAPDMP